ncbi:4773_t:CDS:2 [Dentiscutata erythropus]|uniref:4773_t:CDS:1 n=1 Tax=Dentiscutata erythropus TaxID=1348616 RepID=A0A9N9JPI5_9GLOM|nr:4773_t:CDS:2 [Dentiscutata erythropus]
MSTNRPSRHHGFRGYAADHDRLKRALLQPVQSWVKKWQYPNGGKNFEILKWTKSDKKLTFDDADESGIVVTTRQQVNSEDTPTPTASIIQPPTEASTPQPSETEPDSSFSRPPFAKATSLLRQASLTSAVSTPGENLNSNNNNTPREIESSVANNYGERTDEYERQINEYPDAVEEYGEQNSEYEGPSSDYGGPSTDEYDEQASEYEEQTSEFMEQTEEQSEHIPYQGQVTTQITAYIDPDKEILAETKSTEDGEIEEGYEYLEDL